MANSTGSSVDQIWDAYLQYQAYEKKIENIENPAVKRQTLQKYKEAFSNRINFILENNPPTPEEFGELSSRINNVKELEEILHKIEFGVEEREQEVEQVLTTLKENLTRETAIRKASDWKVVYWEELCINFPWEDYKFNCFISSNEENGNYILNYFPEFKDKLRSNEEMVELFEHIKKYMEDRGIMVDPEVNYEEMLKPGQKGNLDWFEALKYFQKIVSLGDGTSFHIRDEKTGLICVRVSYWWSYRVSDGSLHCYEETSWKYRLCMK